MTKPYIASRVWKKYRSGVEITGAPTSKNETASISKVHSEVIPKPPWTQQQRQWYAEGGMSLLIANQFLPSPSATSTFKESKMQFYAILQSKFDAERVVGLSIEAPDVATTTDKVYFALALLEREHWNLIEVSARAKRGTQYYTTRDFAKVLAA